MEQAGSLGWISSSVLSHAGVEGRPGPVCGGGVGSLEHSHQQSGVCASADGEGAVLFFRWSVWIVLLRKDGEIHNSFVNSDGLNL